MAAPASPSANPKLATSSPRPSARGRDNAKNTPCRYISIYGYCKNEKDGCPYNHDMARAKNPQTAADSVKKRFNVESPAFKPSLPESNGTSNSTVFSPKALNAAPFTPKSVASEGLLTSRELPQQWNDQEIPEFYPQSLQNRPVSTTNVSSTSDDPFNPYADTSHYGELDMSTTGQQINPYMADAGVGDATSFYHQPSAYTHPLQYHLYAPVGQHEDRLLSHQRTVANFFIPEDLRRLMQRKAEATLQVLPNSNLPTFIEHFHSLVPLSTNRHKGTNDFGYKSWLFKATSSNDGNVYTLRRLEGFRLTNERAVMPIKGWKNINNSSIVGIHDCFTTRAFGDSSLIIVYDFHPCSETLAAHHTPSAPPSHGRHSRDRPPTNHIPEETLWGYIVQITSALRTLRKNKMAARKISLSKIILTDKNRIRLSGCGVLDVVRFDEHKIPYEDLHAADLDMFGKAILQLATNYKFKEWHPAALDAMHFYSHPLRSAIGWLLRESTDIDNFAKTFLADRLLDIFDRTLHYEDSLMANLQRELENSRMVRLMAKLGLINERPEYGEIPGQPANSQWSETGDRYMLKLFRDYVFHQVDGAGRPVVNLAHIVACLNRLDAGSEEKIVLVSRDEATAIISSYKEIKRQVESAFQELLKAQQGRH